MKRTSLLVLFLLALLAGLAVLPARGRARVASKYRGAIAAGDCFHSPAALRWRQGQHAHWRTCMLQH
jgi:hypothetical protein